MVKRLQKYLNGLADKERLILDRLAQIAVQSATDKFSSAIYDGRNDVVVSYEWIGDMVRITAQGDSVAFIEFGVGIHNPLQHPLAAEFGAVRGGYGQGKGKQESWGYHGDIADANAGGVEIKPGVILTKGNDPNYSMFFTAQELREVLVDVAREVFNVR